MTIEKKRLEWGEWHGDKLEYARLPLLVITNPDLSAQAVRAYGYMVGVIGRPVPGNSDGRWHLTKRDICKQAHLSDHTWRRVVRELEAAGLYLGERPEPQDRAGGLLCWVHHVFPPAQPASGCGSGRPTTRRFSTSGESTGGESTRGEAATLTRGTSPKESEQEKHTPARARGECVSTQDRFDAFWSVYPEHTGEVAARRVWRKKRLDDIADKLIADVKNRRAHDRKWRAGYPPAAVTYLRDERWRDEVARCDSLQDSEDDIAFRLAT